MSPPQSLNPPRRQIEPPLFVACLCLLALTPQPAPKNRGAIVLVGKHAAEYQVEIADSRFTIPEYSNNGYSQRVTQSAGLTRVQVRVTNNQLASKLRARKLQGLPANFNPLAARVNAISEQGFLADQVAAVIDWLHTHVDYELEFIADQSLDKVLDQRSANCVGFSNVAVEALAKLGVKARMVTGIAFQKNDKVRLDLEGNVLHRWIEVWYEDVGWVFCDPSGKANFVPATYIVLGIEGLHDRAGMLRHAVDSRVELMKLNNGLRIAGSIPQFGTGMQVRPNRLFIMEK